MALWEGQGDSLWRLGSPSRLCQVEDAPSPGHVQAPQTLLRPPRKSEAGTGGPAITGLFFLPESRLAPPLQPPTVTCPRGEDYLRPGPVNPGAAVS